jgi:hypothetical protein
MSKGSGRRPSQISSKELEDNWNRIFSKANNQEDSQNGSKAKSKTPRRDKSKNTN